MAKQDVVNLITNIYEALNTLELRGYKNCKTYSNCMDAIQKLSIEVTSLIPDDEPENVEEQVNIQ